MTDTYTRTAVLLAWVALVACGAPSDQSTSFPSDSRATLTADALQHPRVPILNWAKCGDDFPGTDCTVAEVPLDYDHPRGETTFIALARVPATDQAHKIGTLFINPGGPGVSGVDFLLSGFPDVFLPPYGSYLATLLGGRFDIIGFDPRGVARSEPIHCFDTQADLDAWWAPVPYYPFLTNMEPAFFDAWGTFARQCLRHRQRILSHMSTADVARDLDLLRQAVGDARLNYVGLSYGSYLGETYAALFPSKVRALVIDGVVDPRLISAGAHIIYDAVAPAKEWKEFLRLCDEAYAIDPSACPLSGPEGAAVRFNEMLERLLSHPDVHPGGWITYDLVVTAGALGALYAPEFWGGPDGYAAWLSEVREIVLADIGPAGTSNAEAGTRARNVANAQENYPNGLDAQWVINCSDAEFPSAFAAWSAVGDVEERVSLFGPLMWWLYAPCATLPASADRYAGPWNVTTSAPVLVVGNYFDGITSYDSAVAASTLLSGSRLLSYAGWGHTALARSNCVAGHVATYLLSGTLPPKRTVCPAPPNPFLPSPLLRAVPAEPPRSLPRPWTLWR